MTSIVKTRIGFIATLFGSFSFILITLIQVKNVSWGIASVAMLLCTALSFILSLFLTFRLTIKKRKTFISIALTLFVLSIISFYSFQDKLIQSTVIIDEAKGDSTVSNKYFIGSQMKGEAIDLIKIHPELAYDNRGLIQAFENKFDSVWIPNSVRYTELHLSVWYILFTICIVSCISLSAELLSKIEQRKPKRTKVASDLKVNDDPKTG